MKQKKEKHALPRGLSLCLAVVMLLVCVSGCRRENTPDASTESAESELTEPTLMSSVETTDDLMIDTPYATVCYPEEYESYLLLEHEEGEIYRLHFTAEITREKIVPLFTLLLNCDPSQALGRFKAQNGQWINVGIESPDFIPDESWTDSEISRVYAMKDALNHVLSALRIEALPSAPNTDETQGTTATTYELPSEEEQTEPMEIPTPYGNLYYPAKWEGFLRTQEMQEEVFSLQFICALDTQKEIGLFTIYFGGDQGAYVTELPDGEGGMVSVRLEVDTLQLPESMPEEEKDIVFAMQEDLNFLLQHIGT